MASLKNLSVRHLRELARKHLGPGHTKLKTKDELLAALKRLVPGRVREASHTVTKRAETPAEGASNTPRVEPTKERATEAEVARWAKTTPEVEPKHFGEERETGERRRTGETVARSGSAQVSRSATAPGGEVTGGPIPPRAPEPPAAYEGEVAPARAPEAFVPAPPPRPPAPQGNGNGRRRGTPVAAEPLVEGFFVARVAGQWEARRHHLTEDQVRAPVEHGTGLHYDEQLPDIPWEYQDDRVVLLARDPSTLFVYWDFHPDTRRAAFDGLEQPRAVLRVLENGHEVRAIDLALESRSFYVSGLRPARPYRVELHALGRDGTSRRIGPASNDVALPANDVSSDTTVRFMRVPWGVPLSRLRDSLSAGEAEIRALAEPPEPLAMMHSRWVPLPNSGSWQLVRWIERYPREAPAPGAPSGQLPHLELGPSPLGGASSWTLVSSWWSSPGGSSWAWAAPPSGRGRGS
jgi:hypothetical protein